MHDLRRTLGSWQAAAGASLPIIGKSLGHKSLRATQVYARLNLDPVRTSVNQAVSAMVLAANKPKLLEAEQ
jgi:integrase